MIRACRWFLLCVALVANVQAQPAQNVILVTLDGVRWQEVFRGIDARLAADEHYNELGEPLTEQFGANTPDGSAARLWPFLHDVIGREGVMIGNRDAQSCGRVTNPWFFSYPGYNEILTGVVDPAIDTNEARPNPNTTFLEWLHRQVAGFNGKVQAFGSWDAFPAIINSERSGVPVNVTNPASDTLLAKLQQDLPTLWPTVRYDAFAHHYALQALQQDKPRVLYIAYGETDDFAHDGRYDQYLLAAHRTDRFLRELWDAVQADPVYRDNTVLFITTDHGRGNEPLETWQHHASKASLAAYMKSLAVYEEGIVGSDAIWMAAIGAGIPARGPLANHDCIGSNQIAATLLTLLGLDPQAFNPQAGVPIRQILP